MKHCDICGRDMSKNPSGRHICIDCGELIDIIYRFADTDPDHLGRGLAQLILQAGWRKDPPTPDQPEIEKRIMLEALMTHKEGMVAENQRCMQVDVSIKHGMEEFQSVEERMLGLMD